MSSLRLALRRLRHDPAYAVAFVLTLGLGIGATTAIFSAVEGILLRPLPFPDADRIAYVQQAQRNQADSLGQFSFVEVADYRRQASTVDELVEYGDWQFSVAGIGEPELVYGGLVTSNYFTVLGLRARHGRTLVPADDVNHAPPVAVLTYEYWRRAFGGDPAAVGRVLELTGIATSVVGVLEPGAHYAGTQRADLYANYSTNAHYMGASMQNERTHRMTDVYARVRPGVSLAAARAEMEGIARRLHAQYPAEYPATRGFEIRLTSWRDVLVREARTTLWMLMGTVALVLVVAIANVGNLTLTCLIRRERELSVRAALGAPPRELRAHLLTEHAILALGGAMIGVVIAWLGLRQLVDYTARLTLRAAEVEINGVVLGFSLAIAVTAALLFAWTPRLPGAGGAMPGAVGGAAGRRTTQGRRHRRAQKLLVAGQVALSFIVLAGAGLLVRSLVNLQGVDVGFELRGVTSLEAPNSSRWALPRNRAMFDDVIDRLSRMPGVVSVATATSSPFDATEIYSWRYRTDGRQSGEQASSILFNTVSSAYFSTLDVPMRRGRGFEATDGAGAEPVVVISERFGQLAFPDETPIGRRVQWSFDGQQWSGWRTVIGVAADTRDRGPQRAAVPTIYQASTQVAPGPALLIRTTTHPDGMAAVREATRMIREQDPKRPIVDVTTLEDALAKLIAPSRLNATLFGGFGLLALGIAAVGVGGVLAFAVSERTREFGIRAALGATRGRILRAVLTEGLALTAGGLVVGALGGVALTRLLEGLLFEVQPLDAAAFSATAALIAGVALVASWLPARGATRVDPAVVLRAE